MAKHIDELDKIEQLIKESRLSEAYSIVLSELDNNPSELRVEFLALVAGLAKALSLATSLKQSDELLTRVLPRVTPKDDHYFLGLADELTRHSESTVISTWEIAKAMDHLIDQSIHIREELIGPDRSTAEVIIDSVMTNLTRAREAANSATAKEAASRLTRCRSLMDELSRVYDGIARPSDLLAARVATLTAFFAHSAGMKKEAKENYLCAIEFFERVAATKTLERTDVFEMFVKQGPHFDLSPAEKQQYEHLKKEKGVPRTLATMHKIKAFPSVEHINEMMQKARKTRGKTFYLTSLGFLGTQSLMVSVTAATDGDLTFCVLPSQGESATAEVITLVTDDAHEVLRHIKDLWKKLQARPAGRLTVSTHAANFGDFKPINNQASAAAAKTVNATSPSGASANAALKPAGQTKSFASMAPDGVIYYDKVQTDLDPSKLPVEAQSFEGNLKTMPSLGLLQTITCSNNTGVLEVTHQDGPIAIYFDAGTPIHGSSQTSEGVDVLYKFVMQQEGWFRFVPGTRAPKMTIKVRPEQLIIEAASLFDESKYLKSLGLTMYSLLLPKESLSDLQELTQALEHRGIANDANITRLYQSLMQYPIAAEALDQSDLSLASWTHALYKLVQGSLVVISNEGLDDSDVSRLLVTTWTYDKKKTAEFASTLCDSRTGLLRFEFLVFTLERELERARTQMWPLSLIIFEIRKRDLESGWLSPRDKEVMQTTLEQIADTKRSMDWLCHFQDDQFALLMPGLDKTLAAMFGRNLVEVCSRNLGKLREGQSAWDYSFGLSSIPMDTIEWPKMVGFALEAQRTARMSRQGLSLHGKEEDYAARVND